MCGSYENDLPIPYFFLSFANFFFISIIFQVRDLKAAYYIPKWFFFFHVVSLNVFAVEEIFVEFLLVVLF